MQHKMESGFNGGPAPPSSSFSNSDENVNNLNEHIILAISYEFSPSGNKIGISFLSNLHKCFYVCEFSEDSSFSILESLLLQIRPKWICINSEDSSVNINKILNIIESCEIEKVECPKRYFNASHLEQDLSRLLKAGDCSRNHLSELNQTLSCRALCCILAEWSIMSDLAYFNRCDLAHYSVETFLRLDRASFSALLILPKDTDNNRRATSVFGLLNRCRSSFASKRLKIWITQPLVDSKRISDRHDIVEVLVLENEMRQAIHSVHLKKVPDLDKLILKFHRLSSGMSLTKSKLTLEDIVKLYDCVVDTAYLLAMFSEYRGIHYQTIDRLIVQPLNAIVEEFIPFRSLVEQTIDLKEAENGNYVISRKFDETLANLMNEKENLTERMETLRLQLENEIFVGNPKRSKVARDEKEAIRLIEDNSFGFVFRVTKKDQPVVQAKKGLIQSIRLNKNEFLFTHPTLKTICKAYELNASEYAHYQHSLVEKALSVASTYWPVLEKLADLLSMIDILAAFAVVSASAPIPYARPYISDNAYLKLDGSRHALMEAQAQCNSFIANDIVMDWETSRLHIITGPNMGGKSTYIRQVALSVLMCQIGCFVPCRSAHIPMFSHIMCRVGASDFQLRGISTFLAEMVEASAIIKTAGQRSLVLIDELGRGTSTFEGFGLAWAIAKHLCESVKCYCLFATHFHEMGELEKECKGVVNSHAKAVVEKVENGQMKLTFLYQICSGCCDQSYGVEVAKMAGAPDAVVAKAQQKSLELELVEQWEAKRARLEDAAVGAVTPWEKLQQSLSRLFCVRSADEFCEAAHRSAKELRHAAAVSACETLPTMTDLPHVSTLIPS